MHRLLLGALVMATVASANPLVAFRSEHVEITVEADSLRVDGVYRLSFDAGAAATTTLLYPYPDDPLLGGAVTGRLECRESGDDDWRPLDGRELGPRRGILWFVPAPRHGDRLEVRTTYRQALRARYARYIVTTTARWGRPLDHASFVVRLPADVEPLEFTFPFQACADSTATAWCYEAAPFAPDRDLGVRW